MTPFSVFAQDADVLSQPSPGQHRSSGRTTAPSGPAVLRYGATDAGAGRKSVPEPDKTVDLELLPRTVLRLPKIERGPGIHATGSSLGEIVFWVAIGLGALLAIGLIWSDHKPQVDPTNEAPSWSVEAASHEPSSQAAPFGQVPPANVQANPSVVQEPGPDLSFPSSVMPDQPPQMPRADSGFVETPTLPPQSDRTARSGDTQWDGTAPRTRPGEAAPVGTIITTPVQP